MHFTLLCVCLSRLGKCMHCSPLSEIAARISIVFILDLCVNLCSCSHHAKLISVQFIIMRGDILYYIVAK